MVIWLRNPSVEGAAGENGIGVAGDVVRGAHLASIVDIEAGFDEMRRRCDDALDAARAEAQTIVAAAAEEYAKAGARGYEDGLRQGLTDWHAYSAQTSTGISALQTGLRERIAGLVVMAVEQIVATSGPAALFAQALATVDRIVADGSLVKVYVHPDDLAAASAGFAQAVDLWREGGRAVRLQVTGEASLAPGSCICETDIGAVNASLSLHMEAIRAAVVRAVQAAPWTDGDPPAGPEAVPEDIPETAPETAPDPSLSPDESESTHAEASH